MLPLAIVSNHSACEKGLAPAHGLHGLSSDAKIDRRIHPCTDVFGYNSKLSHPPPHLSFMVNSTDVSLHGRIPTIHGNFKTTRP